ncbi:MAG: cytochrome C [Burkholderiales bacterium]|nr:cytochrome C [Burkholderiales bacterium]
MRRLALPLAAAAASAAGLCLLPAGAAPADDAGAELARGRYLAVIGGCNDCHTEGYAPRAGQVPERLWLTGSLLGASGPWGTTYPSNLRLSLQAMSADQWVQYARGLQTRPPMPWFKLRAMSEPDLRALYAFVRTLGPAGEPAPAALPPGVQARGPVVQFPGPPPKTGE